MSTHAGAHAGYLVSAKVALGEQTHATYEAHAERLKRPLGTVLADQLERFKAVAPDDRPLVLTSVERELLEEILGTPLLDAAAVLRAARARSEASLAGVKIGPFEPWQVAELKRRAEKNGTTLKAELEAAVGEVMRLAFHGMGG